MKKEKLKKKIVLFMYKKKNKKRILIHTINGTIEIQVNCDKVLFPGELGLLLPNLNIRPREDRRE